MVKINDKTHSHYLNDFTFLGKGNNGEVYLLPTGKAIKIPFDPKSFKNEYTILQKVNNNKYFPKLYEVGENYMIRECVYGEILSTYIKKNRMDENLGHKIIELLKEFKKLKFTKIDIRCKDIFVQSDGNLKIIDPKKFYSRNRNFPQHLSKGLYKLGALDSFLEILKHEEPKLYKNWCPKINTYLAINVNNGYKSK